MLAVQAVQQVAVATVQANQAQGFIGHAGERLQGARGAQGDELQLIMAAAAYVLSGHFDPLAAQAARADDAPRGEFGQKGTGGLTRRQPVRQGDGALQRRQIQRNAVGGQMHV